LAAIVGISVGGVVFILVLVLAAALLIRRRRQRQRSNDESGDAADKTTPGPGDTNTASGLDQKAELDGQGTTDPAAAGKQELPSEPVKQELPNDCVAVAAARPPDPEPEPDPDPDPQAIELDATTPLVSRSAESGTLEPPPVPQCLISGGGGAHASKRESSFSNTISPISPLSDREPSSYVLRSPSMMSGMSGPSAGTGHNSYVVEGGWRATSIPE
jgi:hypothetical protein